MQTQTPPPLAQFQDAFARALLDPLAAPEPEVAALAAQPAFAVYRNTVTKGCVDALAANFPAVARLVGEEWFRAAAAIYARANPPATPMLLEYGASFPDFLAGFEPAAALPYLPGVARLDRLWTESHAAATRDPLAPAALAALPAADLERAVLQPHPAARWAWFESVPVYTIWSRNRTDRDHDAELDWRSEGALLVRPGDSVAWQPIDAAGCAFLAACAAGEPLGRAAAAALAVEPACGLEALMCTLLGSGAFIAIRPGGAHPSSGSRRTYHEERHG
ncbi:MAG: putative DNA-binding domain-containing protein [Burkholderiales bacterium]|nr:putative DNA-binding domain-containing protein [Burkholderiales bacterium]